MVLLLLYKFKICYYHESPIYASRLMIVSCEAKKKQRPLNDHELFTRNTLCSY